MKYLQQTLFFLFINVVSGDCQIKVDQPVAGTRLVLKLPKEFKEDRDIPGFRSEIDSSTIFVVEIENPYSFDELIARRISNAIALGIDTSNFKKSSYDGYKSIQFDTYLPEKNQIGFTINFGSDDFLVDISITASKDRIEDLKRIVLKGNYNESLKIDLDELLGFTASFDDSRLKIFKKDANTLNVREKDDFGNVLSWLNLTRMPKSSFSGLNSDEAIKATFGLYKFDKKYVDKDSVMVDDSRLVFNTYVEDHTTYQEYTIIGIIRRKGFDLLVVGGVGNKDKLSEILKVLRSIKFNDRQC